MAHIPGLYLKPESFSPSYGRKKMTDTPTYVIPQSVAKPDQMCSALCCNPSSIRNRPCASGDSTP